MPSILAGTGTNAGAAAPAVPAVTNTPLEIVALLVLSAALATALTWLRVPAGALLGAMIVSALLHATGLVHGRFPPALVVAGFLATGAVIGSRFRDTSLVMLRRTIPAALGSVLLALAISAAIAGLGTMLLGLPFGQLWLAYAPGGVEAMAAMALALKLDPAFVGAHHVLRILGLNLINPIWLRKRKTPPEGEVHRK